MNLSKSYKDVLTEDEYETSVEVEGFRIKAKAFFNKSLPFFVPFKKDEKPLQFLNDKVISFGFSGYHNSAEILYYKNDDDFAIKLFPQDAQHEIILLKIPHSRLRKWIG